MTNKEKATNQFKIALDNINALERSEAKVSHVDLLKLQIFHRFLMAIFYAIMSIKHDA